MKTDEFDPSFFRDDASADCTFRICGEHHCIYMTLKGHCYRFSPADFQQFASVALQVLQRLSALHEEARPLAFSAWESALKSSN